ncbi:hypothetical protein BVC80_1821g89 [Macleaya cordata]|uniref:Uncharacterized protein n=1 Tax=Macleaya cordata TaxID=56857 RepID=A0A200QZP5_MACCD|nr:hypothetical protein BVC80_1821g89 [Macleaya cordata]
MVVMLMTSTRPHFVHCRSLRSTTTTRVDEINHGCEQTGVNSVELAPFTVSTNNSSSRHSSKKSVTAKLVSGPSKKGHGH